MARPTEQQVDVGQPQCLQPEPPVAGVERQHAQQGLPAIRALGTGNRVLAAEPVFEPAPVRELQGEAARRSRDQRRRVGVVCLLHPAAVIAAAGDPTRAQWPDLAE
jgi:hypothetical protein